VDIDGWTTGEYNYIRVYTTDSARHRGKWDDSKYRLEVSTSDNRALKTVEAYTRIEGLQIKATMSASGYAGAVGADNMPAGKFWITNNIMRGVLTSATYSHGVSTYQANSGSIFYVTNNIIYDFRYGDSSDYSSGVYSDVGTVYAYNNTFYNNNNGIKEAGGTLIVKNNIVQNCPNTYFGSFDPLSDYNISSDSTAPGSNSSTSTTVSFLDSTNDDFHLDPSDTAARNAGVSLFHDATSSFSTDIDGTSRGAAWDIGADELPVEFVSTI